MVLRGGLHVVPDQTDLVVRHVRYDPAVSVPDALDREQALLRGDAERVEARPAERAGAVGAGRPEPTRASLLQRVALPAELAVELLASVEPRRRHGRLPGLQLRHA